MVPYIARVSLLVVRHTHAGQRAAWSGDDSLRPLSEKGVKQALGLADALVLHRPGLVVSSPAVRCVTTVEPLADQLGVEVVVDDRLAEGAGAAEVQTLLRDVADGATVVCTHGDVIPRILDQLIADGMTPEHGLRWAKGSTWVVGRDATGWGTGTYLAPPGS